MIRNEHTQTDLHIGLIGTGSRVYLAGHAHRPGRGSRVMAAMDPNPSALEKFQAKYGRDTFICRDYHELLARRDIDAVFILSPDCYHAEQATAALRAGKAVYLEKPMATSIEGCDRILRAAYETRGKLYLGHNMRHMNFILKMKELIDQGRIGQVKAAWCRHFVSYGGDSYFKDWHSERDKANSLLLQKGSHDLDIIHWLSGGRAKRVSGMGALTLYHQVPHKRKPTDAPDDTIKSEYWPPLTNERGMNPVIDVEDLSMLQMEMDNGVFASYQQCHYTPDAWRNYTFIGTEGRIENLGDTAGRCVVRLWNRKTLDFNPYGDEQYFIPEATGSHGGGDPRIVEEFLRYVIHNERTSTSPIDARYAVAAGALAAQSLRQGGSALEVPDVSPEILRYFDGRLAGGGPESEAVEIAPARNGLPMMQ